MNQLEYISEFSRSHAEFTVKSTKRYFKSLLFSGFSLRVENLTIWSEGEFNKKLKKREKKAILKGISLQIPESTLTAILGPSGSGKTTFMNFLAGRQETSQSFVNYCQFYLNNV